MITQKASHILSVIAGLTVEIENIERNLSNPRYKVSDVIETACDLSSLWHNSDLETRRQIQNLVFPHGVFWDKEIGDYRTDFRNRIFDLMERLSMSYKKRNGEDFLFSVALCGNLNEYRTLLEDFRKLAEFHNWLKNNHS